MSVYVDTMRAPFGRMIMCHMFADDIDDLHAMAHRIGVSRRWFQTPPKASWDHYDICLSKKALAIAYGAVELPYRELPRWYRELEERLLGE